MIFATSVRIASRTPLVARGQQLLQSQCRLMSTVPASTEDSVKSSKRQIHTDPPRRSAALDFEAPPMHFPAKEEEAVASSPSGLANRLKVTAEVTVSKIFPAGFGWQSSSILAEDYLGYSADSVAFALTTGLGDAVGVFVGHSAFYAAKKAVTSDESIDMSRETQTGLLLASAAFCSGTVWQPLVDMLQGMNLPFLQVFAGTWVGCGTAFYLGLRGAREILSGPFKHIHAPTFENSVTDRSLSVAIGGATGFFVGTDAAYLPSQNFLINVVGIHDATPALAGCAIAGASTSLGFMSAQTALNVVYPAGKLWND